MTSAVATAERSNQKWQLRSVVVCVFSYKRTTFLTLHIKLSIRETKLATNIAQHGHTALSMCDPGKFQKGLCKARVCGYVFTKNDQLALLRCRMLLNQTLRTISVQRPFVSNISSYQERVRQFWPMDSLLAAPLNATRSERRLRFGTFTSTTIMAHRKKLIN